MGAVGRMRSWMVANTLVFAVVFSKSYCPYCRQTKKTLDDLNAVYELLELDQIRMLST